MVKLNQRYGMNIVVIFIIVALRVEEFTWYAVIKGINSLTWTCHLFNFLFEVLTY
jgi:hypothetical protein